MLTPKEQALYFRAFQLGFRVLDTQRAVEIAQVRPSYATKLLHKLAHKHAAIRAAKGIYALVPPDAVTAQGTPQIDPYQILDQLMHALDMPYYVAYASAAFLHGASTELPMGVSVASPLRRRGVHLDSTRITFHRVPKENMFGTQRVRQSGEYVTISDLERTLVDCTDRLDLCGGIDGLAQIAWEIAPRADASKLAEYIQRIDRPPLAQRLGYVLWRLRRVETSRVSKKLVAQLLKLKSKRVYLLEPSQSTLDAPVDHEWGVCVNADPVGWLNA